MTPHVSIVILNWRNVEDTLITVASCKGIDYPSFDIIIVDNDSRDESEQILRRAHPDITVIQSGANLGYAGGNNVGLRHAVEAGADFCMILNNDATIEASALRAMVQVAETEPRCAIVTPLIARYSDPEVTWACGGRLDMRTGDVVRIHGGQSVSAFADAEPFDVDVAEGAAMLLPTDTLIQYGWMAEDYFLYFEETDWCCRIARHGGRVVAVPQARVLHKVSGTLGTDSPLIDYYFCRNRLLFLARNAAGAVKLVALVRATVASLATVVAYTVKPRGGVRRTSRNARVFALRDAILRRWGKMGDDVAAACSLPVSN